MRILFVGSNPSTKNTNPNIPFEGTRSEKVLLNWIKYLELQNYEVMNIFDETTENNRPLTKREIKKSLASFKNKIKDKEYDKIIALGSSASTALKLLKITHYRLMHPSPRNRQLNDQNFVDNQLKECKVYIYENN